MEKELKTAQEFYDYFSSIDSKLWTKGSVEDNNCKCVLGHLGGIEFSKNELNEESMYDYPNEVSENNVLNLARLLANKNLDRLDDAESFLFPINDNGNPMINSQAKQNILDALQEVINKQNGE